MVEDSTVCACDGLESLGLVLRVNDAEALGSWQALVTESLWGVRAVHALLEVANGQVAAWSSGEGVLVAAGVVVKFTSVCDALDHCK